MQVSREAVVDRLDEIGVRHGLRWLLETETNGIVPKRE
jgi:hypothetical protein